MQHAMHCYHYYADQYQYAELAQFEYPRYYKRVIDQMEFYLVNCEPPDWEDIVDEINNHLIKTNNRFLRTPPEDAQ